MRKNVFKSITIRIGLFFIRIKYENSCLNEEFFSLLPRLIIMNDLLNMNFYRIDINVNQTEKQEESQRNKQCDSSIST